MHMGFIMHRRRFLWQRWRWLGSGAAVLGVCTAVEPAMASAGQWRAGVSAGAALATRLPLGPQLGAHFGYGVLESLDVQLTAMGAFHVAASERSNAGFVRLFPELVYRFDVLRWVPWVSAGGGYFVVFDEAPGAQHGGGVGGALGLDYLWSRQWSLGAAYRADWTWAGPARPVHQALLRFEWRSAW